MTATTTGRKGAPLMLCSSLSSAEEGMMNFVVQGPETCPVKFGSIRRVFVRPGDFPGGEP